MSSICSEAEFSEHVESIRKVNEQLSLLRKQQKQYNAAILQYMTHNDIACAEAPSFTIRVADANESAPLTLRLVEQVLHEHFKSDISSVDKIMESINNLRKEQSVQRHRLKFKV